MKLELEGGAGRTTLSTLLYETETRMRCCMKHRIALRCETIATAQCFMMHFYTLYFLYSIINYTHNFIHPELLAALHTNYIQISYSIIITSTLPDSIFIFY